MKAPSEKHLEDWIVDNWSGDHGELQLLARQIPLPSGVADLLWKSTGLTVMELKKGSITSHTLSQCLRYMRDVKMIVKFALARMNLQNIFEIKLLMPEVNGILIGYSISDTNLLIAAEAANVSIMTYDAIDDGNDRYCFDYISTPKYQPQIYADLSSGFIGKAAIDLFQERHDLLTNDAELFWFSEMTTELVANYLYDSGEIS